MMMKKLSEDHYIVVDDSEIKEGDFVYSSDGAIFKRHIDNPCQTIFPISKVTRSTQPIEYEVVDVTPTGDAIEGYVYDKIQELSLSEVKELLGVVDVHTKAMSKYSLGEINNEHDFTLGYKQALEDNKEKKYTEDDLITFCIRVTSEAFSIIDGKGYADMIKFDKILQSLQPKTEWEVEFVDGKLKLK